MALAFDTSNDTYTWAVASYWESHPVTLTVQNLDTQHADKIGGITLHMIACNSGTHSIITGTDGSGSPIYAHPDGVSGTFGLYDSTGTKLLSNEVEIPAVEQSNVMAVDGSYPSQNNNTWFLPRYRNGRGAQWGTTDDGTDITESDYNNAFHDFILKDRITISPGDSISFQLRLISGTGTYQLSDLQSAIPLHTYSVRWKPGASDGFIEGTSSVNVDKVVDVVEGLETTGPTVSRPDYDFDRWNSDISEISDITSMNGSTGKINQDRQYTAVWIIKCGDVTFYWNRNSNDNEIYDTALSIEYLKKTLGSVKPNPDPSRPKEMYRFLGWSTSRTGSVLSNTTSLWDSTNHEPRDVFYAIWEKIYTVWIRENGVWVKKLNVRRYNQSTDTWEEQPPREKTSNGWVDKL